LNGILRALRQQFGGYTDEGTATGEWVEPASGQVFADQSLKVTVACHRERLREAAEAVRSIGQQLGQLAMWFCVSGPDGVDILDI
jgi:hypothetical protein